MELHFGIVVKRDSSKGKLLVEFPDLDGVRSYWIPVLRTKTLHDKSYSMPDIGEHVACAMKNNLDDGVVLGSFYSDADAVPVDSLEKEHYLFKDGTFFEYDREKHVLTISLMDGTKIEHDADSGDMRITGMKTLVIEAEDNITLKADRIDLNPHLS